MTTNGMLLSAEIAEALVDLEVDRVAVSIDGVTPEHYVDIRHRGEFDLVIGNMQQLRRIKLRKKGRRGITQSGHRLCRHQTQRDGSGGASSPGDSGGRRRNRGVESDAAHTGNGAGNLVQRLAHSLRLSGVTVGGGYEPAENRPERRDHGSAGWGFRLNSQSQLAGQQPQRPQ